MNTMSPKHSRRYWLMALAAFALLPSACGTAAAKCPGPSLHSVWAGCVRSVWLGVSCHWPAARQHQPQRTFRAGRCIRGYGFMTA